MKREDVKQKIPGITDEQLQWLMDENGADVTREKKRAGDLQAELDTATAQLKTAQGGLAAFVFPFVLNLRRNSDTLYRTICVCPNPDFYTLILLRSFQNTKNRLNQPFSATSSGF